MSDPWTQEQQLKFEAALLEFTPMVQKYDRWREIATLVEGKSMNQCLQRYKFLKDFVAAKKKAESLAAKEDA